MPVLLQLEMIVRSTYMAPPEYPITSLESEPVAWIERRVNGTSCSTHDLAVDNMHTSRQDGCNSGAHTCDRRGEIFVDAMPR